MEDSTILRKTISKHSLYKRCQQKAKILFKLRHKKETDNQPEETAMFDKTPMATAAGTPEHLDSSPYMRHPNAYLSIPEIPVYEPTFQEFNEPLLLIENLAKKGYGKYGCVKIKRPAYWNPDFSFNPNKKISVRRQILKGLNEGKSFEQKVNAYTMEEYQQFATEFAQNYNLRAPFNFENIYRAQEYEYWGMVEDPLLQDENVAVEYAADLPSTKYGSGFPTKHGAKMTDRLDLSDFKTHPLNFNNLSRAKDSLFQIITRKNESISGISSPWMYAGMLYASFCWHVEDLYMYSINYMHVGEAKTWYVIPSEYKNAFDDLIKEKFGLLFLKDPNLLYNIVLTMNPLELIQRNIPVYRTEQTPGDFLITFPNAYHAGFCHGFNITEAVNLAVPEWIPFAKKATKDYARDGFLKKCTFPYEWIVMENIIKLSQLNFSQEAKDTLIKEFKEIKEAELQNRETVAKCYSRVAVKSFDNPNQRYDSHTCSTCNNYTYLSFLSCLVCKKSGCTHHITICDCLCPKIILNVRYTEEELEQLLENASC